jgi:hypothetical protein
MPKKQDKRRIGVEDINLSEHRHRHRHRQALSFQKETGNRRISVARALHFEIWVLS